jgi:hypothetical protein
MLTIFSPGFGRYGFADTPSGRREATRMARILSFINSLDFMPNRSSL